MQNYKLAKLVDEVEKLVASGNLQQAFNLYQEYVDNPQATIRHIACFNYGTLLKKCGNISEAIRVFELGLQIDPDFLHLYVNLGICHEASGNPDKAIQVYQAGLQAKSFHLPENNDEKIVLLKNISTLLYEKADYFQTIVYLKQSLEIDPNQPNIILSYTNLIQKICRWPMYEPFAQVTLNDLQHWTSPLTMLAITNDPAEQNDSSQRFFELTYKDKTLDLLPEIGQFNHDRIRIGYLSSDLSTHAVSLLTVGLFENHDRNRFEVHAFCWSKEDGSPFRNRVCKAFDHFHRIDGMNDREAANFIRSCEIDIIVDLHGVTKGARPAILSARPAPIQMTYLGFPGTAGLPWIDYIVVDRYLVPECEARHYSEKPLYVDGCFQVSDDRRLIGPTPTRQQYNLPEKAFVFCSFNNNYKFTPELFTLWMKILKKIPESILWLLADNQWAKENLIQEAKKRGIKQNRIIFAARVIPEDYLARYQLADLFLDTFPFNGGTTANDALFMGLPLLTLSGRTFPSRMAGSLLNHLGLPELIAENFDEYYEKAIYLAKNPQKLKAIQKSLLEAKTSTRVFSTADFTRRYEKALCRILTEKGSKCLALTLADKPVTMLDLQKIEKSILLNISQSSGELNHPSFWSELTAALDKSGFTTYCRQPLNESENRIDNKNLIPYSGQPYKIVINPTLNDFATGKAGLTIIDNKNFDRLDENEKRLIIESANKNKHLFVVPSEFSKNCLVAKGMPRNSIFAVPCGLDHHKFQPLTERKRADNRKLIGMTEANVIFLFMAEINKENAADVMLKAFFLAAANNPQLRLFIKSHGQPDSLSLPDMLNELAAAGQLFGTSETLKNIIQLPPEMSFQQISSIYHTADYYLAPYRSCDFNLPVLEAIACGTPAIVTSGGATDEFCDENVALKIKSSFDGKLLEPDLNHLVETITRCGQKQSFDRTGFAFSRENILYKHTWERSAKLLMSLIQSLSG